MNSLVLSDPSKPPRSASDPDPEVPERARRRHFTAKYKIRILAKADRCSKPGEISKLLRKEGLYSSHLSKWRQQREEGALAALAPKKRGRKPRPVDPQAKRVAELERGCCQVEARHGRVAR
jgi:transposase-like protein